MTQRSRRSLLALVVACYALALPLPVAAQGANAALSGSVRDETGAMLPGATVAIRNVETSLRRELVTDAGGRFAAPNLPPGLYEVTVTMPGFAKQQRTGIRLTIGQEIVLNLVQTVRQREEQVEVAGEAATIDTTSGSTGTLISEEQITGLPLNGRSFIELATLTPGVQLTQVGGRTTSTGFGVKLSVNGARYTQNLFTLDGTMLNDQFNQAGSASGNVLGVEA
ncbi:MAG TPA: carboxypeptidase-like regulatory domain-containing protein, partial [Vicinamibacteria bacterium]